VTSPDGLQWEIRTHRAKLPGWRHSQYEPSDDAGDDVFGAVIAYLLVAPVMWFIVPLFTLLAEFPVALSRGLFSSDRWIHAAAAFPSNVKIEWKVDKANATALADEIADRLTRGYDNLTPEGAQLVAMSEPPGLKDV
jgi:hypothetical protein